MSRKKYRIRCRVLEARGDRGVGVQVIKYLSGRGSYAPGDTTWFPGAMFPPACRPADHATLEFDPADGGSWSVVDYEPVSTILDAFGSPLAVGDRVLFATGKSGGTNYVYATVQELVAAAPPSAITRVRVQPTRASERGRAMRPVTLYSANVVRI